MIWTIVTTLAVYWLCGMVIAMCGKEDWLPYWAIGLIYPVLYVLLYPIRAWGEYSRSKIYYEKHNINRLEYILLHRRVNRWWKKGEEE